MRKVTFRSVRSNGRLSHIADPYPNIEGKVNGKIFAQITRPSRSEAKKPWSVSVRVADGTSWKWITFRVRFAVAEEAKVWLQEKVEDIFTRYQIVLED